MQITPIRELQSGVQITKTYFLKPRQHVKQTVPQTILFRTWGALEEVQTKEEEEGAVHRNRRSQANYYCQLEDQAMPEVQLCSPINNNRISCSSFLSSAVILLSLGKRSRSKKTLETSSGGLILSITSRVETQL